MSERIISLHAWCESPSGVYLLAQEQQIFDRVVADIFGYHALQLGLPFLSALAVNRMPHRWLALDEAGAETPEGYTPSIYADGAALPFPENSLDLVVLPHTLDSHGHPHAALREVARVLAPSGRVVISGFNPFSLWGLRRQRERLMKRLGWGQITPPAHLNFIGSPRLRDWMQLLDFEVESLEYIGWLPLMRSERWLRRWRWMNKAGSRWWPVFGAAYVMVAVKRVHGMRLLMPEWKRPARAAVTSPLVRQQQQQRGGAQQKEGMH